VKWNEDKPVINSVIFNIDKTDNKVSEIKQEESELLNNNNEAKVPVRSAVYYNLSEIIADTSDLRQIYSEPTLNVRLRYPNGWTYIDQNIKDKLDGVTFWSLSGSSNPPPYIHLEVKEKYLFNPARFRYKTELNGSTAYYNDPEELSSQVSQVVYIRTDSDEDYSIKLILNGREAFKSFQPVFFSIVKSFTFND
jgi:hypothetical protein